MAALLVVLRPETAEAKGLSQLPACQPAGQACVAVKVVQGGQQVGGLHFTSAPDTAGTGADVTDQTTNTTYAIPGSAAVPVERGTSVNALITRAGVDPSSVTFAEVDAPDGYGRHLLTAFELQAPGPSQQVPVFYPNPNSNDYVNFIRPQRGPSDNQLPTGPDQGLLLTDDDGALEIVVHLSGRVLDVAATATPVAGSNNRSYQLSAAPGGGGLTATWVFPDGSTSSDPTPTYTFPDGTPAGTFPISVAVENPADGSFGWGTTRVQLGSAPTPSASSSPSTGTGGQGGGHHGTFHGHQGGSGTGHGSGHGGGSSATTTPSAQPTATATGTAGPPGPPTLVPTAQPTRPTALYPPSGSPSPPPAEPSPTTATPTPTPTPTPQGDEVTGVLLTAADSPPPDGGGQVLDVPSPAPSAAPALDPSFRVATWVWLVAGGVLLVAVGAASESARVRRRLRPLLGRWSRIGV